ncbi:MAG TPA: enoyl-CoA hydratase/isomerase family protein [Spirochaetota bacterium]|nr:enoyl-CoA hydratase/isomerase family protein [Spirochaetota bacterium]HNT09588.1 enoyl-CoA hydratase/isomerase family protein [Spirochaetota bacterium]HNV46971.1 enoyl-CoA hydratase/isomerase family protein [Spirochaetota bacterium]HOS38935.1 enoyl-CoA hydratase/isomerase family protein [Spirochaetota bacterium]HPU87663.1 enoyl-CoA hydratase/isomerase family protein [Spirochaetota bacterium]
MAVVEWKKDESVALVTMTNGENRHNPDFVKDMLGCLEQIKADADIKAVVVTSNDPKNFCLGVDINWLGGRMGEKDMESIKKWMYGMNDVFKAFLLFPKPVIAAINGHAFGNGAIMACSCDFRFMRADRGFFCFPEVTIGIPFLPGMIAFVRKALPEYKFNEMYLTGKRVGAAELAQHGIIEKASAGQDELMADAVGFAKTLSLKPGIFGEMKKRKHKAIIDIMDREDPPYVDSLFLMVQD